MNRYVVFLDIDGTLSTATDNSTAGVTLSAENIRMIEKVRSEGHLVFANTGRSYAWIPQSVVKLPLDGIISGMGTQVRFHDKIISETAISKDTVKETIQYFSNSDAMVIFGGSDGVYALNNDGKTFSKFPFLPIKSENDFETVYSGERIQKIEIFRSDLSSTEKDFFRSRLQLYDHGSYIEANPFGCSKANALESTIEMLDIPKSNCIAMGDSVNDISMLNAAGIAVAMGNAAPEVKKIADFVSISCAENGVAYALQKLICDK